MLSAIIEVTLLNLEGDLMIKFKIEETDEKLTPHAGLGIVGMLLSKTNLKARLDHYRFLVLKQHRMLQIVI